MKRTKLVFIMLIVALFVLFSCSEDSTGPDNAKPGKPSNPSPEDNETDVSLTTTISWDCVDPEGDSLTYDVYFGTSSNPSIVNSGQSSKNYDPGTLIGETTYYWKIKAHDNYSNSTTGDIWEFATAGGTSTVTDIDGNVYQTIQIGNQIWMAENLKVTHYRNGSFIPEVTGDAWGDISYGAWCNYNNDEAYGAIYGHLYNWYAVGGIAPEGWHVPTDDEWKELEIYLGMNPLIADLTGYRGTDEGGKLKETGYELWNSPNAGATNESGFTALPGGWRNYGITYCSGIGGFANFWTSSVGDISNRAWVRSLSYDNVKVNRFNTNNKSGHSVRCVKD